MLVILMAGMNVTMAQTVTIGTGTSYSYYYGPMYRSSASSSFDYSRHNILYTAAELSAAGITAGAVISTLSWDKYDAYATTGNAKMDIYMKNSGATTLVSGTAWSSIITGATLVYSTTEQTIPATTGWVPFNLSTPFVYTGGSLEIITDWDISMVAGNPATGVFNWYYTSGLSNTATIGWSNSAAGSGATTLNTTYGGLLRPNIQITYTPGTDPYLAVNPGSLAFGFKPSGTPSAEQSYQLYGDNLTSSPITVTAPAGFEISLTSGGPYTSTVDVVFTPPTLAPVPIYARFYPTTPDISYSGNITNVGGGASVNEAVTGTSNLFNAYCPSNATSIADEDIFNVTLGTINNTSDCNTLAPGVGSIKNQYSNYFFDVPPAELQRSTAPAFSVAIGTCGTGTYSNAIKIFIDFNQDGDFNDANEEVYVSPTYTSGAHTETGTILVPADAVLGNTMMRVVNVETTTISGIVACGTYSWGETEDYKVTITEAPACLPPASLTATNITGFAADLGWTELGTATTWDIEWGPTPFTPTGTPNLPGLTSTTYNLSGLTPETGYAFYVRSNCGGTYSTWTGPKTFTTTVACPAPTGLTAKNITSSSATLEWTSMGTLFDIEWMLSTATPTGTPNVTGVANPYLLSGLAPATSYKYYVRQDCGVNGTSTWGGPYTFMTLCEAYVPYFAQDFQGATFPPVCWSRATGQLASPVNMTSTTSNWIQDDWMNVISGDKAARLNIWSTGLYSWLITPQIDLGAGVNHQLDFDLTLNAYGTSNPPATTGVDDKFAVVISTDGGATWDALNTLRLWDNAGSAYVYNNINPAGEHVTIPLTGYSGVVMIGFYGESTVSNADNDLMVNNVVIDLIPACSAPTNLLADNIGINQAFLDWTDNATATQWDIEWGPAGFVFGTGTRISATDMKPYKLLGLTQGTDYGFYVRALCPGGGYSSWSGPQTFTTQVSCPAPTQLSASNIQPTSAELDWRESGSATEWEIQWGLAGFTLGTGTIVSGITVKPYTLSGLTSSTNYGFYVRSVCAPGDASLWVGPVTFTTPCEAVSLPFAEDFSGATIPACWSQSFAAPLSSNRWSISTTANAGGAVNEMMAGWQSGSAISRLISPPINTAGATLLSLSFRHFFDDYGAGINYKIQSSADGTNWTDEAWGGASGAGNIGPELVKTTIANNLGGTTYIAWVLDGNHFQFDNWYMDNVSITFPLAHDVATSSIDMSAVNNPDVILPKATVSNVGLNTETFPVTMTIGTYTSTQTVTDLAPGASVQVTFDPWNPPLGVYTVDVCTQLAGDLDPTNDCQTMNTSIEELTQFFAYNAITDQVGYFYREYPGTWVTLAPSTSAQFIGAGTWANGVWYGSEYYDGTTGGGWWTLDPVTGAMTKLADLGIGFAGITYNPFTGIMYGVNWNGTTSDLYTIIPATGAYTLLGSIATGELMINLANDGSGFLYALGISTDHLFKINPDLLTITDIGATGQALNYAQDMEYDFASGIMYAAAYTSAGALYTVDLSTGWMTLVGAFAGGAEMTGFAIPYCGSVPTNVFASNVTTATAVIDWTDAGSPAKWDIEFGPTGFTHGTGTKVSGITTKPYTISGLAPGTTYDVYVRGYCEYSKSAWSVAHTFATCGTIATYPFTENFDALTVPAIPNCWTTYASGAGNPWISANVMTAGVPAHSTPNFMYVTYNELLPKDEWLVTPGFDVTAGNSYSVKFWVVAPGYSPDPEKLKLVVASDPTLGGVAAGTVLWTLNNQFLADYTEITVNYIPAATGVVYFAWHAYSDANVDYIGLDDITIDEILPTCLAPTGVGASPIASESATLNWTEPSPAPGSGYQYEVRTSGDPGSGPSGLVATGYIGAGITTVNVTGLTPATLYHGYVRSNCGDNVYSDWTADYQFTTLNPLQIFGSVTNASCPTAADGAIDITVTGGLPPYTYMWSNGSTNQNLTGLLPGTYYVTVTDANLETVMTFSNVLAANPVCENTFVTGTVAGTSCFDALNTITVAGGVETFVVTPTGNATFIAGAKILYLPGTTVQAGGYMLGKIAPTGPFCSAVKITEVVAGQENLPMATERIFFTLYPNPTNGNFTLVQKGDRNVSEVKVVVYNMSGGMVMNETMAGEKHEFRFADMPHGIYFVKVVADDYVETIKLVKTR